MNLPEVPTAPPGRGVCGLRRWLRAACVALALAVPATLAVPSAGALAPKPAGKRPSAIAEMICAKKAQVEIGQALGVQASVSTPTWKAHVYSCTYQYATGSLVLSVKELSSWKQTYGYFDTLATALHKTLPIQGLGQGAFRVRGGSIVVRKDWKVLLVDVRALPSQFGTPPSGPAEVALTVAGVIMACWHGD